MRRTYTFRRSLSKRAGIARDLGLGLWQRWRSDAVLGDESLELSEARRDTWRGDRFAFRNSLGDFEVQGEELGEQILLGAEAVGGEDGGVQGGVGVFEGVGAGEFEGAVEGTQAAFNLAQGFFTHASDFSSRVGHRLHLGGSGRLWPWKRVENRFGGIAITFSQFAAFCDEPEPVWVALKDAEAVVVCKREHLQGIRWKVGAGKKHERGPLHDGRTGDVARQPLQCCLKVTARSFQGPPGVHPVLVFSPVAAKFSILVSRVILPVHQ